MFYQGKLIDHDTDQVALLRRIQGSHGEAPVLIRQVHADADTVIMVRTPRFDHA